MTAREAESCRAAWATSSRATATERGLAATATPGPAQLEREVPGIRRVRAPVGAYGGSDGPESERLRELGPRSALLLGRALSLPDIEAMAIRAGAVQASVRWAWHAASQGARVIVTFVPEQSFAATATLAAQKMEAALRTVAPPDLRLVARVATSLPTSLVVAVVVHPDHPVDVVKDAVRAALLDPDAGFLAARRAPIGRRLYRSHLLERIFGVGGVLQADVDVDGVPLGPALETPDERIREFAVEVTAVHEEEALARRPRPQPTMPRPVPGPPRRVARDGYDAYYARKLWHWIPELYRTEDAEAGGLLRAFVEALGVELAMLRRRSDRIWEEPFIDSADDSALPSLAALVATRTLHPLNPRGRRVDIAKTIHYRRRKGTPAVLEELVRDIGGMGGSVVEAMFRLARPAHLLDGPPKLGRFTETPRGGFADLRSPRIASRIWSTAPTTRPHGWPTRDGSEGITVASIAIG